jgi:hypothetical protein
LRPVIRCFSKAADSFVTVSIQQFAACQFFAFRLLLWAPILHGHLRCRRREEGELAKQSEAEDKDQSGASEGGNDPARLSILPTSLGPQGPVQMARASRLSSLGLGWIALLAPSAAALQLGAQGIIQTSHSDGLAMGGWANGHQNLLLVITAYHSSRLSAAGASFPPGRLRAALGTVLRAQPRRTCNGAHQDHGLPSGRPRRRSAASSPPAGGPATRPIQLTFLRQAAAPSIRFRR